MAAPDAIHDAVKNALVKEGWTITHDPYTIDYEELTLFADLGIERPLGVERAGEKLVIESKSFRSASPVHDFKLALGQYLVYRALLEAAGDERALFLAIGNKIYREFFCLKAIQTVIRRYDVSVLVVNLETEEIERWIS